MTDELLLASAERVFSDTCTPDALTAAERDGWAPAAWDAVSSMGLPWISIAEESGGSGGTLGDALAVLRVAGAHGAPVPLAETLLAGWLLAGAGLPLPDGPLTVVPGRAGDTLHLDGSTLSGTASGVAWAAQSSRVVALVDGVVVSADPATARIASTPNLAGEPRATVTFDAAPVEQARAGAGIDDGALRRRGALTRVMLIAGALEGVSALANRYAGERQQFGQAIASFQAVQALLVTAAEEAAVVTMAAEIAAIAAERGDAVFEIAAAKTLADNSARTAARAAHQAHGAIGMTQEYPLHHLTRRLWAWRAEYGDAEWPRLVGSIAAAAGADGLYDVIRLGSSGKG